MKCALCCVTPKRSHLFFVFIFHLYNHVNFTWSQKKMKFHDSICSVAGVESDKVISCLWPYRVVFPSRKEVNHPPQLFLHSRPAAPSPSVPLLLRLVPQKKPSLFHHCYHRPQRHIILTKQQKVSIYLTLDSLQISLIYITSFNPDKNPMKYCYHHLTNEKPDQN